ncbi:hypothetical protein RKD49_006572 [Streptomyces glaucescens]
MRPAVRVLIVTALAAAVVGGNAPAVLAEPAAEVSPGRAAPDGDVTVSVTCDDLGGTPPDTLEATSQAFEDGLVELRLADGQENTATGPVYRGTARIALPQDGEAEEAEEADAEGGDEGAAEAGTGGQGKSGQDSAWTVDGTCPAASGAQGRAFSASFTVAPGGAAVSPGGVTAAPDSTDALAAAPSDEGPATAPLEEGLAKTPLDEDAAKTPLDEGAAKIPLDEGSAKTPLDEGLAKIPLDESLCVEPEGAGCGTDTGHTGDALSEGGGGRSEAPHDSSSCTGPKDRGCEEADHSGGGRAEEPRKPEPCPDLKDPGCGTAVIQRGVRAGEGGAFDTSVPALVAGGVLIAGAFGGAVYRLRGKAPRGDG